MPASCDSQAGRSAPRGIVQTLLLILIPLGVLGVGALTVAAGKELVGYSSVWAFVLGLLVAVLAFLLAKRNFRILSGGVVHFRIQNKQNLRRITRVDLLEKPNDRPNTAHCDEGTPVEEPCESTGVSDDKRTTDAVVKTHHVVGSETTVVTPTVIEFNNLRAPRGIYEVHVDMTGTAGAEVVLCKIGFYDKKQKHLWFSKTKSVHQSDP